MITDTTYIKIDTAEYTRYIIDLECKTIERFYRFGGFSERKGFTAYEDAEKFEAAKKRIEKKGKQYGATN